MPVILIVVAYLIFENTHPSHAYILLKIFILSDFQKNTCVAHVHSTSSSRDRDFFCHLHSVYALCLGIYQVQQWPFIFLEKPIHLYDYCLHFHATVNCHRPMGLGLVS